MKIAVTAVVHSGLHRTGKAFRGTEGELVEFVHSDGFGMGNSIAGVWPSGIYGLHHDPPECKYYQLVRNMTAGRTIECQGGGKEVHAGDAADGVDLLLHADSIAGELLAWCDRYTSKLQVANIAKQLSGSAAFIHGEPTTARTIIVYVEIQPLGIRIGGGELLMKTIQQFIDTFDCSSGTSPSL